MVRIYPPNTTCLVVRWRETQWLRRWWRVKRARGVVFYGGNGGLRQWGRKMACVKADVWDSESVVRRRCWRIVVNARVRLDILVEYRVAGRKSWWLIFVYSNEGSIPWFPLSNFGYFVNIVLHGRVNWEGTYNLLPCLCNNWIWWLHCQVTEESKFPRWLQTFKSELSLEIFQSDGWWLNTPIWLAEKRHSVVSKCNEWFFYSKKTTKGEYSRREIIIFISLTCPYTITIIVTKVIGDYRQVRKERALFSVIIHRDNSPEVRTRPPPVDAFKNEVRQSNWIIIQLNFRLIHNHSPVQYEWVGWRWDGNWLAHEDWQHIKLTWAHVRPSVQHELNT